MIMGEKTITFDSAWLKDYMRDHGGVMNITERYVTQG
jgi:hypothetical protein